MFSKVFFYNFQGTSHKKESIPCQDAFSIKKTKDIFICCICDGAGGYLNLPVHLISQIVSNSFCKILINDISLLVSKDYKKIIEKTAQLSIEELQKLDEKISDISLLKTTLSALIFFEDFCYSIQIGDGLIFSKKDNSIEINLLPQKGEFANQTLFLGSEKALENILFDIKKIDDIDGFLMISDGLEPIFTNKKAPFLPSFKLFFDIIEKYENKETDEYFSLILQSKEVLNVVNDDITLIIGKK